MSVDSTLAALVAADRTEDAIDALRAEGVYDDSRSVAPREDRVALPVTAPPETTDVDAVVAADLPRRAPDLPALLRDRGWTDAEVERAPGSWAVVGSVVLVDPGDAPRPDEVGEALLDLHGEADTVLARGEIAGRTRDPDVEVLAGVGETETIHVEHGTRYALDLATVMFSPGNEAERVRMGEVVAPGERVFDMFAGVGYFTLPMARAGAQVTAAEIDPTAYRFLVENAVLNGVEDRIDAYRADCRDVSATADRAVMGYYGVADGAGARTDEAHEYLDTAFAALDPGGTVHLHEATPEAELPDRPVGRLEAAADARDRGVEVEAVRRVKSHSAGVWHVVVDARVA
ncbi:MAG: class I SAM-dependent methyltransferase family protein [Haloarculaceae archaeon]